MAVETAILVEREIDRPVVRQIDGGPRRVVERRLRDAARGRRSRCPTWRTPRRARSRNPWRCRRRDRDGIASRSQRAGARALSPAHSATAAEAPPRIPGHVRQQRRAASGRRQLQPIASGHHAGDPSTADPGGRKRVRIPPWLPRLPSARASASMKLRCSSARVAWARCTAPAIPGSIDRSRSRPCRRPLWRIPTASVGSSRKREPRDR